MKKRIYIILGASSILIFAFIILANQEPLLIKFLIGTAQNLGKPIDAKVYTNGKLDKKIYVYYHKNQYVLFKKIDVDYNEVVGINMKYNYAGIPVCGSIDSYKLYGKILLQSECGVRFVSFSNEEKMGEAFDPELTTSVKLIKFKLPPDWRYFDCDSVMIEFGH